MRAWSPWVAEAWLGVHDGDVPAVALSGGEKLAASAGSDGRVAIWDLASRREAHRLEGRSHSPTAIAFSPDGKSLALGFRDAPVTLWNFAGDGRVVGMGEASAGAEAVAVSEKGDLVATSGGDRLLRVWDARTGKPVSATTSEHFDASRASKLLFSAGDRAVEAWQHMAPVVQDPQTGGQLLTGGTWRSTREVAFRFRDRSSWHMEIGGDYTVSEFNGWSEKLKSSVILFQVKETYGGWSSASSDQRDFVAFGEGFRRAVVGLESGAVALVRPRRKWSWLGTWQMWATLGLGAALAAWLAAARRMPGLFASPALEAPPAPVERPAVAPLSLRVVALLTTLQGIGAAIGMVVALYYRKIRFDVSVLNIWAGPGLLRFSTGWRKFVLAMIWLSLAGVGAGAGMLLEGGCELHLNWFQIPLGTMSEWAVWLLIGAAFPTFVWAYWVLTNPRTRALFADRVPGASTAAAAGTGSALDADHSPDATPPAAHVDTEAHRP